jgi:hypothetical protein
MLKNIDSLIQIIPPDAKIIPGHYSLSDLEDLKRTRRMLEVTISHVQNKMENGKSLDQIKKEGLPSAYEKWGSAYTSAEDWIENLYSALQREQFSLKE